MTTPDDAFKALELALNQALLGRGVTVSNVQRSYRVNYSDAQRLMDLRNACFDQLDMLAALRAAPEIDVALLELRAIAKSLGLLAEPLLDSAPNNGQARRRERDDLITNLRRAEGRVIDAMQSIRLAWTPRPETVPACPSGAHSYRRNEPPRDGDVCFVCRKAIYHASPSDPAAPNDAYVERARLIAALKGASQ